MLVIQTITFGVGAATRIATPSPATQSVKHLRVEPFRTNTAACYVGDSTLTQTGTTGAIKELAAPPASTVPMDGYVLTPPSDIHNIDVSELYVWGTTGDKVRVAYWTA